MCDAVKFGSLEVCTSASGDDKFGSSEVYKVANALVSLEVWNFAKLSMDYNKFGSSEVYKVVSVLIS